MAPARAYDLIVVGSGPGGEGAAMKAAKSRKRVAVVDDRSEVGGACTPQGTIPSKALRQAVLRSSASTARKVQAIDTETGRVVGEFPSGDQPHESVYSRDGARIYHASIGRVFIPTTSKRFDRLKGDRYFQVVDARTFSVLRRFDMREKLEEFGLPWIDSDSSEVVQTTRGR